MLNKIQSRLWKDNAFTKLSASDKYAFLYILTSPHRSKLELFYMPLAYMSCDMGITESEAKQSVKNLIKADLIEYDCESNMMLIKNDDCVFIDAEMSAEEIIAFLNEQPDTFLVGTLLGKLEKTIDVKIVDAVKSNERVARSLSMKKKDVTEEAPVKSVEKKTPNPVEQKPVHVAPVRVEKQEEESEDDSEDEPVEQEDVEEKPKKKRTSAKKKAEKSSIEEDFDEIWAHYPRKGSKGTAFKAYKARVTAGEISKEVAMKAVQNFAFVMKSEDREQNYIMLGSTFFGPNQRFKDYLSDGAAMNKYVANEKMSPEHEKLFEVFWEEYPKKTAKQQAYDNFAALIEAGESADDIIKAAKHYCWKCVQKKVEQKFIKTAGNFLDLNKKPYKDYINFNDVSYEPSTDVNPFAMVQDVSDENPFVDDNESEENPFLNSDEDNQSDENPFANDDDDEGEEENPFVSSNSEDDENQNAESDENPFVDDENPFINDVDENPFLNDDIPAVEYNPFLDDLVEEENPFVPDEQEEENPFLTNDQSSSEDDEEENPFLPNNKEENPFLDDEEEENPFIEEYNQRLRKSKRQEENPFLDDDII